MQLTTREHGYSLVAFEVEMSEKTTKASDKPVIESRKAPTQWHSCTEARERRDECLIFKGGKRHCAKEQAALKV